MAVEDHFAAQLELSVGPELDASDGRLAGRAQHAFGFVGGIGALGQLGLLAGQLHGERQAGVGAALLAVGAWQELLDL